MCNDFQKTLEKSMEDAEFRKLWEADEPTYQAISEKIALREGHGLKKLQTEVNMKLLNYMEEIDWSNTANKEIAGALCSDAIEYMIRVVDHIYIGNEIRADSFMDFAEKQEEIERLDRKRTAAHNQMLKSFVPFLELLKEQTAFDSTGWKLETRTQIADFVAEIAFELMGEEPSSKVEGSIRDELADKIHAGVISFDQIKNRINDMFGGYIKRAQIR